MAEDATLDSNKKVQVPTGLYRHCDGCKALLLTKELDANYQVCPHCGHHHRISAMARLRLLLDEEPVLHDVEVRSGDPLRFHDTQAYPDRVARYQKKTGHSDAYLAASGTLEGHPIEAGAFDFGFMGGSMGSVVGELICRQVERATERQAALLIVSASGGARMQEGILSLMQMARVSGLLHEYRRQTLKPFISLLTDPTTGGVAASFAMLGDFILAEPRALIGFAGRRVIEQTIGQKLPDDFQRAEFLLEHGLIDRVVARDLVKPTVGKLLSLTQST
jgi:acetyl-CoA carboxylase carboxyl transferase subunit beta